jgi:hypothetical protein
VCLTFTTALSVVKSVIIFIFAFFDAKYCYERLLFFPLFFSFLVASRYFILNC